MNKGLKKANILDSRGRLYRPSVVWYWLVLRQLEGFSGSKSDCFIIDKELIKN